MTEREAWRRWRRDERIRLDLAKARLDLARLEENVKRSAIADLLAGNARYRKTVDAFLRIPGWKGPIEWEAACGGDRGLFAKTRASWPLLWSAILESRRRRDPEWE